jgi:hypothetical protein
MLVNWKDLDAFTRLVAMVAAQDMKLDYRKIATMYGNGATYDSIERRFRIIKKEAAVLKSEIDTGCHTYILYIYITLPAFYFFISFALLLFEFNTKHIN